MSGFTGKAKAAESLDFSSTRLGQLDPQHYPYA
jgi:hypothetical protein